MQKKPHLSVVFTEEKSGENPQTTCGNPVVRPVTTAGANAGDKWREGKPVRVTRAWKAKKHSDFAPEEGFR